MAPILAEGRRAARGKVMQGGSDRPLGSASPHDTHSGDALAKPIEDTQTGLAADLMAGWNRHNGIQMAGALAFFGALSAAPLIVVATMAAALILGQQAASGELVAQLTPVIGAGAAQGLQSAALVATAPDRGLLATLAAVVGTLFGAAGVVVQMRTSLDMVLGRDEDLGPIRGALGDWKSAGTAVFAIGVAAVIVLAVWSLATSVSALSGGALGTLAEGTATSLAFFGLLVLGYRLLPSRRPSWAFSAMGAGAATVVAIVVTAGMSVYLRLGFAASVFGAAASFFVFLMWLWLIAIGFIVAAEWIRVLVGRDA